MAVVYYTDKAIARVERVDIPAEAFAEVDRIKNTQDSAGTDHNLWDEFLSKFTFDANNFLRTALASDEVGIAKDSTLSSRLPREIELDDGTGTYDKLYRSGNALLISINEDKVGILKKGDLNFDANGYLNVNAQVVANPPNLDISLSSLRDALKPTRATPTKDLDAVSIAAGGTEEITKSGLNGYSALIVIVRATYDASASAGVRVRWLYSPDGTNYDSPEDAEDQGNYEDLTFSAGATRQRTILIPIFTDNIKIQVVNKDSSYAVTVDAWTQPMR